MDSTDQTQSELEIEISKIENSLAEAVAAEDFFNSTSGTLMVDLFVKEITRLTREVTSDKYRKDLTGYNIALSDLLAYKNILKRLQLTASPEHKKWLSEQLEARKDAQKNG